jgi:RNA polymerase sigma factor (sigma-70 family)
MPDARDPSAVGAATCEALETESTNHLISRAREGSRPALDVLFARYLPRLSRWAGGRLPRWARDMADTDDLVQDTLLRTFLNIERFDARGDLALQVYLRQAVANRIRDELRKLARRPGATPLPEDVVDAAPSPLEAAIGSEAAERYERAVERLDQTDRELIIARVELGATYDEIAQALGKPSSEAARKACERALVRLARVMERGA